MSAVFIKPFLLTVSVFTFVDLSFTALGQTNESSPLQIIVTPEVGRVHVMEPFKVSLEIKNVSNTNQFFKDMSCSWYDNWKSDNPNVGLISWNCELNGPSTVELAPGEIYHETLNNEDGKMEIYHEVPTNSISFRMSFTPGDLYVHSERKQIYWSNNVTIKINPK